MFLSRTLGERFPLDKSQGEEKICGMIAAAVVSQDGKRQLDLIRTKPGYLESYSITLGEQRHTMD